MEEKEVYWEHKWLFVIIPVQEGYDVNDSYVPDTYPLLSAYCKACDTYVTKRLTTTEYGITEGKVGLPKYGCVGPDAL